MAQPDPLWTETGDGRHILSKCGLFCDTCPAFIHGLCRGCPRLSLEDCVVKACAHRKQIATCLDCTRDVCYHFEAYYERRQMVRRRVKRLVVKEQAALLPAGGEQSPGMGCGGCAASVGCGGCATSSGGCGGCAATQGAQGGCSAVQRILLRLAEQGPDACA